MGTFVTILEVDVTMIEIESVKLTGDNDGYSYVRCIYSLNLDRILFWTKLNRIVLNRIL